MTDEQQAKLTALRAKLDASDGMEGYAARRAAIQAEIDALMEGDDD